MQFDNPDRGFSYKGVGPLDMRMNPRRGEPASQLIARVSEEALAQLLADNADEPHSHAHRPPAEAQPLETTHAAERLLRAGLTAALPGVAKTDVKMSIRRTFQALRIAVNDEFSALDALLRSLPQCLAPGGRVAMLTFHSGEDRRVKKAFQAGRRAGVYSDVADRGRFAPRRPRRSRTGAPPPRNCAGPCAAEPTSGMRRSRHCEPLSPARHPPTVEAPAP